jgi:hypothetical protein
MFKQSACHLYTHTAKTGQTQAMHLRNPRDITIHELQDRCLRNVKTNSASSITKSNREEGKEPCTNANRNSLITTEIVGRIYVCLTRLSCPALSETFLAEEALSPQHV